jgi:hypothetical protein
MFYPAKKLSYLFSLATWCDMLFFCIEKLASCLWISKRQNVWVLRMCRTRILHRQHGAPPWPWSRFDYYPSDVLCIIINSRIQFILGCELSNLKKDILFVLWSIWSSYIYVAFPIFSNVAKYIFTGISNKCLQSGYKIAWMNTCVINSIYIILAKSQIYICYIIVIAF